VRVVRKRKGDVRMYDEKWRHGQREEKVFAYWGVWEGSETAKKGLDSICIS